jgi:hypothetical protein
MCCRPFITSKFASELPFHGVRCELNSVFGLEKVDWWNTIRTSATQVKTSESQTELFKCLERRVRHDSSLGIATRLQAGQLGF